MNTISDSVKKNLDTIRINRKAIIDSSAHIRNNLRDTAATMRGLINANHSDIAANAAAITQLQTSDANIANRMNTISDSVKKNLDTIRLNRQHISDSTRMVFDTLHKYYLTKSDFVLALLSIQEVSDKFVFNSNNTEIVEFNTNGQPVFTLSYTPASNHLIKMYINGVLVGDNDISNANFPAVITLSDPKVTYIPTSNGNYQLRDGDRIVFYYYTTLPSQGDNN